MVSTSLLIFVQSHLFADMAITLEDADEKPGARGLSLKTAVDTPLE